MTLEANNIQNISELLDFPPPKQYIRDKRVPVDGVHVPTFLKLSSREKKDWDGSKSIQWGGYWFDHDGYGKSNNLLVKELIKRGWSVQPRYLPTKGTPKDSKIDEINQLKDLENPPSIDLAFCLAPDAHMMEPGKGRFLFYFPWESSKLIPTWVPLLEQADAIITCSNWCTSVIRSSVENKPIFNLPVPIDTDFYQPVVRKKNGPFKVLYCSGSYERKGIDCAVNIFKSAFRNRLDVRFHIHTRKDKVSNSFEAVLKKWMDNDARITYSFDGISEEAVRQQYQDYHVLLHPARCEGIGRTPMEAMATGMPVVATNASGLTEFINEETAYPINILQWRPCNHFFYTAGQWAEPDQKHGAEQLAKIEVNYASAVIRGIKGAAFIQKFSIANIVNRLEDIFKNINRLEDFELEYAKKYGDDISWYKDKQKVDDYFGD